MLGITTTSSTLNSYFVLEAVTRKKFYNVGVSLVHGLSAYHLNILKFIRKGMDEHNTTNLLVMHTVTILLLSFSSLYLVIVIF